MADSGDSSFKYDYLNILPSKIPTNPYHHSHDTSAAAWVFLWKAVPSYTRWDSNSRCILRSRFWVGSVSPTAARVHMAGRLGFEPRPAVLETVMLPLTPSTYMQSYKDSNLDLLSQSQTRCLYTIGLLSRDEWTRTTDLSLIRRKH